MQTEIPKADLLAQKVFAVNNENAFEEIALEIFRLQFWHNPIYNAFCTALRKTPHQVESYKQIPFLPITFFKTKKLKTGSFAEETIFKSSGTTGTISSCHFVKALSVYEESFEKGFQRFYGRPEQYCILGLLPSYLEQGSSSLVYMVEGLVKKSVHPQSGFYLYDFQQLANIILELENKKQPTLLFGVTYALLDFAAQFPMALNHTTIIETGGMKGRRKEVSKPELYEILKNAFSLDEIHSEYGMTELLSQAYAVNGRYHCPPWMKVLLRDETDPFSLGHTAGAINVVDLANIWSCSFIATEDLGKMHPDGGFEVLGRMDNTDIRGCSQMAL